MSLEKANIQWTYQTVARMVQSGQIDLTHIIQRGIAWTKVNKSALIETSILGYPIPPIFAKRDVENNKTYIVMDGKQRVNTIKEFMLNEFTLSPLNPVTYFDDDEGRDIILDISGKKFRDLPLALQNKLKVCSLDVVYFDNLTFTEERELFKRLNAGKPLSAKSKLLASCNDLEKIIQIGSHPLFGLILSDKARKDKGQVSVVMKVWDMLFMDVEDISFAGKDMSSLAERTTITDDQIQIMNNVFDLTIRIFNKIVSYGSERFKPFAAKRLYTEVHFVSLSPYFKLALDEGRDENDIVKWVMAFFDTKDTTSISEEYNKCCVAGSAHHVNIMARHRELGKSYDSFFAAIDAKKK